MSAIFDSLGYVRRLEQGGVERAQAEAHADAARDFILAGVATKGDIERLEEQIGNKLSLLENRMTIKLGGMLIAAVTVMAAVGRFFA